MRFALLTALSALAFGAPASAATWIFDVTGTFAMTGSETIQTCIGGPGCYTTNSLNRTVVQTFQLSVSSTPGARTLFISAPTFGGVSFDPPRSYVTINYVVGANRTVDFTSLSFQGDDRSNCFPGFVGCYSNFAGANATRIGAAFVSSSDDTLPVPEPSTWAMMIGGFGLVGTAMRRRKASLSFA